MLVCSVVSRPKRAAIVADVVEIGAAADALGTGNVVFATLVDDPASVRETVDAFLGQIMLEAAAAGDTVDASLPAVYAADIAEAATAAETADGSVTSAITTVTWDATTVAAVTLSGGNLVATNTGTTATNQGAHVVTTSGKATGKYYFENRATTYIGGGNVGVGIGTTSSTYTGMGQSGGVTGAEFYITGEIYANGSNTGITLGSSAVKTIGVAVDLDNRKIWFKNVTDAGNWNNSGTANPATNTGGVTLPAGTMVPFVTFGGGGGIANNVMTTNFGASAFTGAVPSGFTSGWPV